MVSNNVQIPLSEQIIALLKYAGSVIQFIAKMQFALEVSRGRITPGLVYLIKLHSDVDDAGNFIVEVVHNIDSNDMYARKVVLQLSRCRELNLNFEKSLRELEDFIFGDRIKDDFLPEEVEAAKEKFLVLTSQWNTFSKKVVLDSVEDYRDGKYSPAASTYFDEVKAAWFLKGVPPSFERIELMVKDYGDDDLALEKALSKLKDDFGPFGSSEAAKEHYEQVKSQVAALGGDSFPQKFGLVKMLGLDLAS
ncbi:hypothetical protein NT239_00030 [Chitinibacter sp. SCUT-21]|uniref:hypothetical protein n=1 Tax=Chitinibacter sp. SCUT-21 TaxID=2970891 RepID=UPI0035A5A958